MSDSPGENGQNGQASTPFIVALICVFFAVALAAVWIVLNDKLNANDAYRQTEMRRQRDNAIMICGNNLDSLQILQEWIRQQKLTPPPEGMKIKQCPTIESAEKEK
jgi:hypothetical protein